MRLLRWLWDGLRGLAGLVLPVLGGARPRRLGRVLRWVLHVLLVILILVGLWAVNYFFDLERFLVAPWPALAHVWLPLLFLVLYALCWLGWWLWRLLGPEEVAHEFADIDAAWHEALAALRQAGIDPAAVPVFLVLGQPRGTPESLFSAARLPLLVRNVPPDARAPVHVYAGRDAVYVACPGASLLARQAALLEETAEPAEQPAPEGADPILKAISALDGEEGRSGGSASPSLVPAAPAYEEAGSGGEVLPGPEPSPEAAERSPSPAAVASPAQRLAWPRHPLLKNSDEVRLLADRLRYVCRLIARVRRPYCPVNGLLVLLPLAAADTEGLAAQVGALCQQELATAREALQVHCPVFALVCDLETVPGFGHLVGNLPEGQAQRLLGKRFPLVPDIDPAEWPALIDGGLRWTADALFPTLVYRLLRLAVTRGEEGSEVAVGMYRFLAHLRQRRKALSRILTRGFVPEPGQPPLLGGCYFAATGRDSAREQAFVGDVLRQLVLNQNHVTWTGEALAEEQGYRRLSRTTLLGYVLFLAALGGLVYVYWTR